jgi:hypothetical protein
MNIKDLKASIDYMFKAQVTPFVWGHAGVGKSSVFRQYAQEKGFKYFPFYLGTMSDTGDILGLSSFTKDESGNDVATQFAPPIWLKEMIDYCTANPDSGAVIFLDEFNRGRRDLLNGMFSLALDKTFHTMKLPNNCYIAAAGNPPTEEYYTTDVNETALMARFVHIKLEPTLDEWVAYAEENEFDPTLVSLIQEQPALLADAKSDFTLPIKVDNRSWERVNNVMKTGIPQNLSEGVIAGIIGVERLVAYKLHLKSNDRPLKGMEVLNGVGLDKVALWSNPKDIKSSLISKTCGSVIKTLVEIFKNNDKVLPPAQKENLVVFLETLPKESAYAFFRDSMNKGSELFLEVASDPKYEGRLTSIAKTAKGVRDKRDLT